MVVANGFSRRDLRRTSDKRNICPFAAILVGLLVSAASPISALLHVLPTTTKLVLPTTTKLHRTWTRGTTMGQRLVLLPETQRRNSAGVCISATAANGDVSQQQRQEGEQHTDDNNEEYVDTFQPRTQTILVSMAFFARYVFRTIQVERIRHRLTNRSKRRLLTKLKHAIRRKRWTADDAMRRKVDDDEATLKRLQKELGITDDKSLEEEETKLSLRQTFAMLNESRRKLIKLVGYDAALLVPSFGFLLLGALMTSVIPHYYSQCLTCLAAPESTSKEKVISSLVGLVVANVLAALFTGMRGALFWIAGSRGNFNVRIKLHRNLLLQEASFFDSTETGILLSRLNNDVNKIGMVISFHVNVILRQLAQFIFGSVYLIRISPRLGAFAFGGVLIVALVSALYGRFARKLAESVQDQLARASAVAETSFSMSETVRAFDGVPFETAKYEEEQRRALDLEEVSAFAYGTHKAVSDIVQAVLQCGLLFACWKMGRTGGLAAAQLTSFMFYVNFVLESSNEVGDQWAKIQSAIGASRKVFDLIRRVPAIHDPIRKSSAVDERINVSEESIEGVDSEYFPVVRMKDMSIKYLSMEDPALSGINLDILSGDRVAIVGRSGSGKTSMLRTTLRFYDPASGSLSIGGDNLKELKRSEIASRVSVVEQEPHLFPMTLMENVLYGIEKDSIDQETGEPCYGEERRSAVAVALEVAGLPIMGEKKNDIGLELDTRVGEGGRALSGGQRQRVAIARALIRRPEILLLDEPTAALDSKSERTVVEALSNAMKETKSMLMVTHRLGVVRSLGVNKVVVLERGKIAEMGHPEDLLASGGIYSELAREQGITSERANSGIK